MKKLFSSLLVAVMALSLAGCGGNSSSGGLTTFNTFELQRNEMETFNYLNSSSAVNLNVLTNLVDGLLEHDKDGNLKECLAKEWEHNEDATVWTFHLRDGLKWVDWEGNEVADLTAQDFVTGLKWVLTNENGSNNTSMPNEMVKGAAEYNAASIDGADQATLDALWEEVGVKAIDDHTVEYTMVASKPYFDTATTYNAFYPAPTEFITQKGADFGIKGEKDSILYCGGYTLTEFTDASTKVLTKNPKYWDPDNVSFDTVNIAMLETTERAFQLFQTGELDYALLAQADVVTETANGNPNLVETRTGQHVYSLYFNRALADSQPGAADWNKAAANENFRKAWFYGLDFTEQIKRTNAVNPTKLISNTFTAATLCKTSDGTDYTDLVEELMGYTGDTVEKGAERLDEAKFKECKAKAMEELTAEGVTFPVKVYYAYQSGSQSAEETFQVVKASYEECLGSDFIEVVGQPYIKSFATEVRANNLMSVTLSGWGADYGDPYNFLFQLSGEDGNYMNKVLSHMNDETYNKMVDDANQIVDLDERYAAFAKCEQYALEHALIVPGYTNGVEWEVTKVNDYSKPYAKYGIANRKYKFWETKAEAYTAEEYEELAKAN